MHGCYVDTATNEKRKTKEEYFINSLVFEANEKEDIKKTEKQYKSNSSLYDIELKYEKSEALRELQNNMKWNRISIERYEFLYQIYQE